MKILAIGDVTGIGGVKHLEEKLWHFRDKERIDLVVVNAENAGFITGPSPDTSIIFPFLCVNPFTKRSGVRQYLL